MQPKGPRMRATKIADGIFAAVIRAFMSKDNPKWMKFSEGTRDLWGRELRLMERPDTLGGYSIYEIRSSLVQAHLDGLAEWPGKQVSALAAIRAVEKWALVRDLLPNPISMGCEAEGPTGGHIPWADEHIELALSVVPDEIARAIILAANTGQRCSDLIKMRWTDIENYKGRPGINVTQKKTGKVIWVPMTEPLMAAVATWERRPGFILIKPDGCPWYGEQLGHAWRYQRDTRPALEPLRHVSAAGISEKGLVLHGLRGTACVRLIRAAAHTRQIADMVGMSEPMVARYTRFSKQRENASAAVHYLDERSRNGDKTKTSGDDPQVIDFVRSGKL